MRLSKYTSPWVRLTSLVSALVMVLAVVQFAAAPTVASAAAAVGVPSVSVNSNTNCILNDGLASCWGKNEFGQIGDGTTNPSAVPVAVSQGAVRYTAAGAGTAHACALDTSGLAYCWGAGSLGRLGNGGTGNQLTPGPVNQGALRFASLSVATEHTCGLTAGGQAYCWGVGTAGKLGNGSTANQVSPVPVTQGALVFASVSAGDINSCALTSDGQGYCWGGNSLGQNGDGTTNASSVPVALSQSSLVFTDVQSAPGHTCALTDGGKAYCWGTGVNGRLGRGSSTSSLTPVAVAQSSLVFRSLGMRGEGGCGLTYDGKLHCWGANKYGAVGDGTTTDRTAPVQVDASKNWIGVATSTNADVMCAVADTKAIWCWGSRFGGALGNTSMPVTQSVPKPVQGGLTFASIGTGDKFSCSLTAAGQAYCWGSNVQRQLGNNTQNWSLSPTPVSQGGNLFTSISVGDTNACGLTSAGQAYCWGPNTYGQLGNNTTSFSGTPTPVTQGGVVYSSINMSLTHACALANNGQAYCWGLNTNGRLGNGNSTQQLTPVAVSQGGATYASLTTSTDSTCGLTPAGQAYCWGLGGSGRLGNSSTANSSVPVAVTQGGVTFSSITGYGEGACGLTPAGQAYCWGYNAYGQVGDGTTASRTAPVAVTQAGVTFSSINGQGSTVCGVSSTGRGYCWGWNAYGAIGNGSYVNQLTPTAISSSESLSAIGHGLSSNLACALNISGAAFCWGIDIYGQLGVYNGTNALLPEEVAYFVRINGVELTLSVQPLLSLTIGSAASCNSLSTTAGSVVTPSSVSFGQVNASTPAFAAQDLNVQTNAGQGYDLLVKYSGPLTGSNGAIADVAGTNASPAAFGSGPGFGYTTTQSRFAGPLWAKADTTGQLIGSSSAPVASVSQCIGYRVAVTGATNAGNYTTTITYVIIPKF